MSRPVTWTEIAAEAEMLAAGWTDDNGTTVVELAQRIDTGYQRLFAAVQAGNHTAADAVRAKIDTLRVEVTALDSLRRRLALLRALLILHTITDGGAAVVVEIPGAERLRVE